LEGSVKEEQQKQHRDRDTSQEKENGDFYFFDT
jgi:hypothetical protein